MERGRGIVGGVGGGEVGGGDGAQMLVYPDKGSAGLERGRESAERSRGGKEGGQGGGAGAWIL